MMIKKNGRAVKEVLLLTLGFQLPKDRHTPRQNSGGPVCVASSDEGLDSQSSSLQVRLQSTMHAMCVKALQWCA